MVKKKDEEIPTLEEPIEDLGEGEPSEPVQEEGKLQIVTNEQLIQYKLDNLSIQVQEITSQIKVLVDILKKK